MCLEGKKYFKETGLNPKYDCKEKQRKKKAKATTFVFKFTPCCFKLPPEEAELHSPIETNIETFLGIKPPF